ncbi:hypothetical protein KY284_028075 [Solanum tuberosum]|nr:hypothetical protein KY284_028075 [Solanum tuberosum]
MNWAFSEGVIFIAVGVVGVMAQPIDDASTMPFRWNYDDDCSDVNDIAWSIMLMIVFNQHNAAGQLLRILIHDCLLGLVELDEGLHLIQMIKHILEEACPEVLSDVLSFYDIL